MADYRRTQDDLREEYVRLVGEGWTLFRNGEHWVQHRAAGPTKEHKPEGDE